MLTKSPNAEHLRRAFNALRCEGKFAYLAGKSQAEQIECALAELALLTDEAPARVVITMDGGLIQTVIADTDAVQVGVIDYDVEGTDSTTVLIPQGIGPDEPAIVWLHTVDDRPELVDELWPVIKSATDEDEPS